jgi:hypothetical protein
VSDFGRILLIGSLLAGGLGFAAARAQTVLGDPRDPARTFASNCSTCHKSPQGLAKSGQIAGFLRQHYTTGPEMSAAMAAYLVAAGNAPASKKGAAPAETAAARSKGKKGEQLAAHPATEPSPEAMQQRTLRGKQRPAKQHEEAAPAPSAQPAAAAAQSTRDEPKPSVNAALSSPQAPAGETPLQPAPMLLDIPLPPMPDAPPAELSQSVFASSPLP